VQVLACISILSVAVSNGYVTIVTYNDMQLRQIYFPFICEFAVNSMVYVLTFIDYSAFCFMTAFWLDRDLDDSIICDLFSFSKSFLTIMETQILLALIIYCIFDNYERVRRIAMGALLCIIALIFIVGYLGGRTKRHGCYRFNYFVGIADQYYDVNLFVCTTILIAAHLFVTMDKAQRIKFFLLSIAVSVELPMLILHRIFGDTYSFKYVTYYPYIYSTVHALMQQGFAVAFIVVMRQNMRKRERSFENPMSVIP
ncbi:hypothetical protein PFISCL1PPCAC_7733, partial [Pristionchus fissidentatus]